MNTKIVNIHTTTGKVIDLEIPTEISANMLIKAVYEALHMPGECPNYICCENPITLLYGESPVSSFGLRDGSILHV